MNKTTIITAIYDNYDSLKPVCPQSIDVDWICVTDNPNLASESWKIVYEPRPHIHPNRAAKTPKMLPWLYTGTSTSIWVDASFTITSPNFAKEILVFAAPIAQYKHPWRNCMYEEIAISKKIPKYQGEIGNLDRQLQVAKILEFPTNWGLWATGVIARTHTDQVKKMGFDWLYFNHLYSYQDQTSHPLVCYLNSLRPVELPDTYFSTNWLTYNASNRH